MKDQPRFTVLIGGGIGELLDAKFNLTFKQAVQTWVRGQKRAPTDCVVVLENRELEEQGAYSKLEALEAEVVSGLLNDHRRWVEKEMMKQGVYNLQQLNFKQPFTRG